MDDLVLSELSRSKLRTLVKNGKAVPICRGLYLSRTPTAAELAVILQDRTPDLVLTGITAGQIAHGKPLTLPLHVAYSETLPHSQFFVAHRTTQLANDVHSKARIHYPILAVACIDDDELGLKYLERAYAGRPGKIRLEKHMESIARLPKRSRALLDRAALGTDSGAERSIVRGLRELGLHTESNVFIGPYLWDIVLPKLGFAVEIDGFEYHSRKPETIRDAWKTNDAVLRGWRPLRYTGSCVTYHRDDILRQISTALNPDLEAKVHTPVRQWHRWFSTRSDPWDVHD